MQQRIAQETGRDSSAMKSIAVLTMLFLPSTALAVSSPPLGLCVLPTIHPGHSLLHPTRY